MKSEVANGEETVLQTLQRLYPNSSKNTLRIMLTKGRVHIDGEVVYRAKHGVLEGQKIEISDCLLYTSPSPRDYAASRMPSSA